MMRQNERHSSILALTSDFAKTRIRTTVKGLHLGFYPNIIACKIAGWHEAHDTMPRAIQREKTIQH